MCTRRQPRASASARLSRAGRRHPDPSRAITTGTLSGPGWLQALRETARRSGRLAVEGARRDEDRQQGEDPRRHDPRDHVGRRELRVEQRADRERRVVQRVQRGDRAQPLRRERHRQHHARQEQQRQRDRLGQRRQRVLAADDQRHGVRDGAEHQADERQQPERDDEPQRVDRQAERDRQHDEDQALEQEHDDVAEAPAEDGRRAAHRRHPHPLDDAVAHLVDEPEADERRAEQGGHDEQAGHEHVERAAGREAGHAREAVEQRAEQEEVDERLDDAGDQPGGLAER